MNYGGGESHYDPFAACESPQAAQNQVAAASTTWLHERVILRTAAQTPSPPPFVDLRHYAFIISAYRYSETLFCTPTEMPLPLLLSPTTQLSQPFAELIQGS